MTDRALCYIAEPTPARRRFYFTAIDAADGKTRLALADLGAFTVSISLDGAAGGAPSSSAIGEIGATHRGVLFWDAAIADLSTRGTVIAKITALAGGGGKSMIPAELAIDVGLDVLSTIFEGADQFDANGEAGGENVTVAQALRELLAYASGPATGLNGPNTVYKSRKGGRNRIAGTQANGNRGITSRDNS